MKLWPVLLLLLAGCASDSAFKRADCERFRFPTFNAIVCNDRAVGEHCKKVCPLTDSGAKVDYYPRACAEPNRWGRKPTIVIGKSYLGCVFHEAAHLLVYPLDPARVEREYPCLGEKK